MREMLRDPDRGYNMAYHCSDCWWTFPLDRLSDVSDYFQQKAAVVAFVRHDCAEAPAPAKLQTGRDTSEVETSDVVPPTATH